MPSVTKRNSVPPPALPAVVRPRASDRPEHVAPKNPSTDSNKALFRNSVIDSSLSIVMAVHPPPYACVEKPLHQLGASDAERIPEVLVRTSTVGHTPERQLFAIAPTAPMTNERRLSFVLRTR